MEDLNVDILIPVRKPTDRHAKRAAIFEAERLLPCLMDVTHKFNAFLFNDDQYSYTEIYNYFLEEWQKAVNYNNQFRKPKFHQINEHYFSQLYKPLENVFR